MTAAIDDPQNEVLEPAQVAASHAITGDVHAPRVHEERGSAG
jgi:hypothetical protein